MKLYDFLCFLNKTVLVVLSGLTILLGIVLVGAYWYLIGLYRSTHSVVKESPGELGFFITLLVVGIMIILWGILGTIGIMTENTCLMFSYITVNCFFFILILSTSVYMFNYEITYKGAKEKMKNELNHYYNDNYATIKLSFDFLHQEYECCGVDSFQDWAPNPIPSSCCKNPLDCVSEETVKRNQI